MLSEPMARRSFLRINLAAVAAGGSLLVGCGEGEKKPLVIAPEDDPSQKAKESMDYFKNNNLKKGAPKK